MTKVVPKRREDLERVLRARDLGVDDRHVERRAQRFGEAARFGDRHERVAIAVDDEERRRVRVTRLIGDAFSKRRGSSRSLASSRSAGAASRGRVSVVSVAIGEVVDAVERDAAAHRRVDVLEAGLVLRLVRGERDQRREVPAGGATGDDEEVGVRRRTPRRASRIHRDRVLHVDERLRKRRARRRAGSPTLTHTQPRDARCSISGMPCSFFDADDPAAAVDLQQRRAAGRPVAPSIDVEAEPARCRRRSILDVADPLDLGMAHRERQRDLPPVDARRELLAYVGEDALRIVGAERRRERLLDRGLGSPRAAVARARAPTQEMNVIPRPSQPGHARARPATRRRTVAPTCQARWWRASSVVSQPAKNDASASGAGQWIGR